LRRGGAGGGSPEVVLQGLDAVAEVEPGALEGWLRGVVAELCPDAVSFGVRFVDDAEMQSVNERFRGESAATDVLSFPGEETPEGRHLGDVVISLDTARSQARSAGIALDREVRELLLHGVLHCLGHDHETDGGEMDRLELELRERFLEARQGARR
jgi:rRNA maturation RNase YbeY